MKKKIRLIPVHMRREPELIILLQHALLESCAAIGRDLSGAFWHAWRGSGPTDSLCEEAMRHLVLAHEQLDVIAELFDEPERIVD